MYHHFLNTEVDIQHDNLDLVHFEEHLDAHIVDLEKPLAFDDVMRNLIDAGNMFFFDETQQGLNSLIGITEYSPDKFTQGLLLDPSNDSALVNGDIGGNFGAISHFIAACGDITYDLDL